MRLGFHNYYGHFDFNLYLAIDIIFYDENLKISEERPILHYYVK